MEVKPDETVEFSTHKLRYLERIGAAAGNLILLDCVKIARADIAAEPGQNALICREHLDEAVVSIMGQSAIRNWRNGITKQGLRNFIDNHGIGLNVAA